MMDVERLPLSVIKAGLWWKRRKTLQSKCLDLDLEETKSKNSIDEISIDDGIPVDRKKTAILSRRKTFHVVDDSKSVFSQTAKFGRPRRSISDESSVSSSAVSITTSQEQNAYRDAVGKLSQDDRWKKEKALGTRISFYRLYRDVGKGDFSKVKMAVHYLTKEKVAVKIIDKTKLQPKNKQMLSKEIAAMETIHHPNIIRLFEVMETPSKLFLAMEFAEGGELFHKVANGGRIPEDEAKVLFAQITSAVSHLHKHNIIHRDLKAENVFISAKSIAKIGDFGFSTRVQNPREALFTLCGSPPYVAPEIFQNENYTGASVDVWSLGVLLYFMVSASLPFKGDTVSLVKKKILTRNFAVPKFVSKECSDLINGLLQLETEKRFSCQQIKNCSWLKGVPFPTIYSGKSSVIEKETKEALEAMGITDKILQEHRTKGARSSVIGTYRIILHKKEVQHLAAENKYDHKNIFITCPTFQSKTCVIL